MHFFKVITSNIYINAAILSWFIAQTLKVVLTLITTRKIDIYRFMGNGGMPSSHTAFTVSLAIVVMRSLGFHSVQFAFAFALASVVMTDAMGVRREAGKHAKMLNEVFFTLDILPRLLRPDKAKDVEVPIEKLEKFEKNETDEKEEELEVNMLEEFLGHTPFEVLAGLILGIIVGLLMPIQ